MVSSCLRSHRWSVKLGHWESLRTMARGPSKEGIDSHNIARAFVEKKLLIFLVRRRIMGCVDV